MKLKITDTTYISTEKFYDLSLPIIDGDESARAFDIPATSIKPMQFGEFVGSVEKGGSVNCFDVSFNPHGNGTHTECVGHISKEHHKVHQAIEDYIFYVAVISVSPKELNGDSILVASDILAAYMQIQNETVIKPIAIAIRTLPNSELKTTQKYSNTNPTYIDTEALKWMCNNNILHILTDLPSVDREQDNGVLSGHHAYWNYPENPRLNATITEMIYIPNEVNDGLYMMNLQVSPFVSDAAPSRPILFKIEHESK
ncbi:MAG: cyclase family protein [Bacteroidetes bacterium]|nr:cyclase family protein [Bacteroidota bacterium]